MINIHKDIKTFLQELGLTPTEINLYVTSLKCGPQTASELAKRAGIKRTTAQSALSALIVKGMVTLHSQTGSHVYMSIEPQLIERRFTEQIDTLKKQQLDFINLLPLFDNFSSQSSATTEVSSFQGAEGVKTAVDTALFCASRKWKIIAPEKNFFSEGDKDYADYFIKTRKQRGIKAQSLWEPSFVTKRTFDDVAFEFRDPRVLPKELAGRFKSTVIIFDASVIFVNSAHELSAVLIRSNEISQTMTVMFDGLWTSAKKIPKRRMV